MSLILNFSGNIEPGPVPPVDNKQLKKQRVVARGYRNRRIGDFLKELHLTEGRSTGIPKIIKAMAKNGSPKAIFETDKDKTYFLTTLPIHPEFTGIKEQRGQVGAKLGVSKGQVGAKSLAILKACTKPKRRTEIFKLLGLANKYNNYERHVLPLVEQGLLAMTIPDKPKSSDQKYYTTEEGKGLLKYK